MTPRLHALPGIAAACLLALSGCDSSPDAPGMDPDSVSGGKEDLPNDAFWEREHDTRGYRAITQHFADNGFDLAADPAALDTIWPIDDPKTVMLSRYATPVQNISTDWGWYFHSGADIGRSSPDVDRAVHAPVSGEAKIFDWDGGPPSETNPYSTVVAIWNPESKVLVQLMHVDPADFLQHDAFVTIEQGDVIGSLALPRGVVPPLLETYRHTHVNMVDGETMTILNPLRHLPYQDSVAPDVVSFYALDEDAQVQTQLVDGRLDLVVEIADRDDGSERNFEATAIAYEIRDGNGALLSSSERCDFESLIASIAPGEKPPILSLVDFGNASEQVGRGGWVNNDQGVPDNTYRYALTQFAVDADGSCQVFADDDGFVEIAPIISQLDVSARIWDASGNMREWSGSLTR